MLTSNRPVEEHFTCVVWPSACMGVRLLALLLELLLLPAQPTLLTHPACTSLCRLIILILPAKTQLLGPDVEYIISRAQAIQESSDSPVLTTEHLQEAISNLPGGAGAGGDGGLTKEELEATMKQMLMVGCCSCQRDKLPTSPVCSSNTTAKHVVGYDSKTVAHAYPCMLADREKLA